MDTKFYAKHRTLVVCGLFLLGAFSYGALTETLFYPYIIAERQVQSIRDCTFGSTDFQTHDYGFSFSVPKGYCVLPNRLFPDDGNVEVLPKGWYSSFNEYARGTVAQASQTTVQFEPVTPTRDPEIIIQTLLVGRFLDPRNISSTTTTGGTTFVLATSVLGADNNSYDWALAKHPDGKTFVEIIAKHRDDQSVRDFVLRTLRFQ